MQIQNANQDNEVLGSARFACKSGKSGSVPAIQTKVFTPFRVINGSLKNISK
jgi:hypothetical protein